MSVSRRVACAIPARWGSTRLPGKPLLDLLGKPMIQHVWERACQVEQLSRVVVLTDDERIRDAVRAFGGDVEMTPAECRTGTDRIAAVAGDWSEDAIVNVQGDEPLIEAAAIAKVAEHLLSNPDDPMVTLATRLDEEQRSDPARVKVVTDTDGYALYFSRAAIPYRQAGWDQRPGPDSSTLLHIGLYGYQRKALLHLASLPPSALERSESLEQLRALENGLRIRMLETAHQAIGVDTPDDVSRIEHLLRQSRIA